MEDQKLRETVLELLDHLKIQKKLIEGKNFSEMAPAPTPEQCDLFIEDKIGTINTIHNLILEKFADTIPHEADAIKSDEYDLFITSLEETLKQLETMEEDVKNQIRVSPFDKGKIEGFKQSQREIRRLMHKFS